MDNKKLADLLYPNAKNWEDFEKKYPPRNLPEGAEVTRFAPSPTGYVHIGNFFQCLCDSFIAKKTGGVFYLRIEDTDKKREVQDSIDVMLNTLRRFEIEYDEGVCKIFSAKHLNMSNENNSQIIEKGNYGPYRQSERLDIYEAYAKHLVEIGRAFPCFCEKAENFEEIKERRAEQLEETHELQDHDACRDLTYEQIEENIKNGKPFALRLKSVGDPEKTFVFEDIVKGKREIHENTKDVVLIKSNKIPVYAFAHAIDDHLMRTTIVVRGEEWFPSLASHLEIFDALGFQRVKYAHNPVICKIDPETKNKRKISKRKDREADMRYFITEGYPPQSLKEYLLNIANSNFEIWRKQNPKLSLEEFPFDANKINKNNPMFDMVKLNDVSKNVMLWLDPFAVYGYLREWAWENDLDLYGNLGLAPAHTINVLKIDREFVQKPRKEMFKCSDFRRIWWFMFDRFYDKAEFETADEDILKLKVVLKHYRRIYDSADPQDVWFSKIKELCNTLGYATNRKEYMQNKEAFKGDISDVCRYIRIAVTTKKEAPDLYGVMKALGKETVVKRLERALDEKLYPF